MSLKSEPDMGINSWLEDELYQQYLHDRTAVDESWKHVFEENGGSSRRCRAASPSPRLSARAPPAAAPAPAADANLQPLRGAAARIAENMAACLAIPLATSQRTIAVKVMDENRRIINQHRTLVGKSKVSYTHIIGWAHRQSPRRCPGPEPRLLRKGRPAVPRGAHARQPRHRGGRRGQGRRAQPDGAQHQERRRAQLPGIPHGLRRPGGRARARPSSTPADFQGTTISLTNPGTVGTMASISAADAGPGRHHRRRRHRLPGRIPGRRRGDSRACSASAR